MDSELGRDDAFRPGELQDGRHGCLDKSTAHVRCVEHISLSDLRVRWAVWCAIRLCTSSRGGRVDVVFGAP